MRQSSRDEKRNHARPSDIKPYAVRNNISLEVKFRSQRLLEFGGMPRLFGGPKIPGIDPVAVARRHISDQPIGLPQRTEVLHVRGDVMRPSVVLMMCELSLPRRRSVRRRRNSISSSGISTRRSASSFWARAKMPWSTIGSIAAAPRTQALSGFLTSFCPKRLEVRL